MRYTLTLFLLFCFVQIGNTKTVLDSLLSELSALESQNSIEDLRKKAKLCTEISDGYNLIYGDQDYSRTYLLQSKQFLERVVENKNNATSEDLINLTELYRKLSVYELSRGKVEASNGYMKEYEKLLTGMKAHVTKKAYNQALYEYNHSLFAINFSLRNLDKANAYIEKAIEIVTSDSNLYSWRIYLLSEQSVCYSAANRHDEAIEIAREARELFENDPIPEIPYDRFIYFELRAMNAAGKFSDIINHVKKFKTYDDLEHMETYLAENEDMVTRSFFENIFLVAKAHKEMFKSNGDQDNIRSSFNWFCDGFTLGEKLTVKNDGDRIGNIILRPKEKIVSFLETYAELTNNFGASAMEVMEIIRVLDSYQSSRLHRERISNSVNSELWAREKEIQNEITFINLKIEEYGEDAAYENELSSLNQRINKLSNELVQIKTKNKKNKILEAYKLNSTEYNGLLKSHLNERSATLLTYFYSAASDTLFIVGLNKDTAFFETVFTADLGQDIEEVYQLNGAFQSDNERIGKQLELNNLLYNYLIAPIENQVTSPKLLIYPLNELSFISFDALRDNEGSYLVNSYNFQYTTSIFSIISPVVEKMKDDQVLSFYPTDYGTDTLAQLFNAQDEVKEIEKMINATTYLNKEATKTRFLNEASGKKMVHLATHSVLNFERPYESYVLFEETDDSVDNKLFAYEIFPQIIDCEMVTLSSCNSAKGEIEEGIGVVSLANAFYYAGVPSTVSSLWSAQDKSSSKIMVDFYANIKLGLSKSESLQRAKIDYLQDADKIKSQPFFWANYVVYGNDEPLYEMEGGTVWWKYLVGIGLTIILIFLGRKLF